MRGGSSMKHQIETDGVTVWVTGSDGSCVGRFGAMGVDIHHTVESQVANGVQCLLCTHGQTGPDHWDQFVAGMKTHHDITIPDRYRPIRFGAANDA